MNIFYLDADPDTAARLQYNKHVVKMVLESAQMLCSAHHFHDCNPSCKQWEADGWGQLNKAADQIICSFQLLGVNPPHTSDIGDHVPHMCVDEAA